MAYGHEDRVKGNEERVYLQCAQCGRATPGWQLGSTRPQFHLVQPTNRPVSQAA
jgi:hypothetical protein